MIRASFCLLEWGGEREALLSSHQTFGSDFVTHSYGESWDSSCEKS